jgi:triacylglycerol lipase
MIIIPKLRAPIVLVHGLLGFSKIEVAGATLLDYFRGIPELMIAAGNRVYAPLLSPTGSVAQRANQLKEFLVHHTPGDPVHLIAHSLGGLDSRYMISCLDMAPHVLTLTTLGTPHRGTSFADWGISRFARIIQPMLDSIGLPYQAFYDLTKTKCKTFNETVLDAPNVRYFSVGGKHDGHLLQPEWYLPYSIVSKAEGENDGIVSLASANYGEYFEEWEGDHLMLVNMPHPMHLYRGIWRDPAPRYGAILRRLADLGY